MTLMQRRRALMAQQKAGGLPSIYQQVAYIEAESNGPVIDTLVSMTADDEIRCGVEQKTPDSQAAIFGQTDPSIIAFQNGNFSIYANFARATSKNWNKTIVGNLHDIILNKTSFSIDGTTLGSFSGDFRPFPMVRHVMIFAWPKDDTNIPYRQTAGKCSYFQIWRGNTLLCDLIPCYRKSDGVIGMYDTVAKEFRTNVGIGTFTKGADV